MKSLFKNLGANQKEMETFLLLLELGAQPASTVAKKMGTPRSTMYLILDKLRQLGLIEEFERSGVKYFKCTPIKDMKDVIVAKRNALDKTEALLEKSSDELFAIENKLSITPTVRFLEDEEGVSKMYEQVLKQDEFYAFFNPEFVKKQMPSYHFKIPETLRKQRGRAKELLVDTPDSREYQEKYHTALHQIKILDKSIHFDSDLIICKERIYMISYGEDKISALEIINQPIVETHRALFEHLWEETE